MLTREEAGERAAAFLADRSKDWISSDVRIIPEYCFVEQGRLIAPYDHCDYLDRGKEDMQLAGNLPVAVEMETGKCMFISWDEADDFMERDLL
ncbi:hypothetical protein [Streptomyces sp. NPDC051218]|uniref:hypothetical protein n=1 Tax=Streptomyces sp. NPDC051218 TaxID=3365645 RepID=UPI0037A283D4